MSLYNYLVKSRAPYEEMYCTYHQAEVVQLYNLLKEIGFGQYYAFLQEHQEDILKYIGLAPSQRQQKKWVNNPNILLIRFGALQISYATVRLLDGIVQIDSIVDSGSYRKFHSVVADQLGTLLLDHPFAQFPFEVFPNPFLKGSPQRVE